MIELEYSPQWFYGKDIAIDIVSILVLFLIAHASIKYYKLNKEKKSHLLLGISFLTIGLSFLFKIITNFTIDYHITGTQQIGNLMLTYTALRSSEILSFIGFLMHRILMLMGLYLLYCIYVKQEKSSILITTYLLLVSTYFGDSAYYIFHITAFTFLTAITIHYLDNYKKSKHEANKWLAFSFMLITISQVVFIFIQLYNPLYVVAELIQLAGYTILLTTFIKVLRDGKKKRKK